MTKKELVGQIQAQMNHRVLENVQDGPLTRAEAAAMLIQLKCLAGSAETLAQYPDGMETPEAWQGALGMAARYGYLEPNAQGHIEPNRALSAEEAARMLAVANPGRHGIRAYTKELKRPCGELNVEQLWFRVNTPQFLDRWVELDQKYWTQFLMGWDAIGRKDYWMSHADPCAFNTVIYGTLPIWKEIGPERCQALDKRYIAEMGEENYHFLRGENDYRVVAYVANQNYEASKHVQTAKLIKPMAIEELKFRLKDPCLLETWLQADHSIWTQSLAQNDGFYRKDIWQSTENPCLIKTVIYWRTREDWLAYDHNLLAPLDSAMETALGEGNCLFVEAEHESAENYLHYMAE